MKRSVFLSLVLVSYSLHAAVFNLHQGLTSSKGWLGEVARVAECVVADKAFLYDVAQQSKFTHTDLTPYEVAKKIRNSTTPVKLTTYKTINPWSKAIAYRNIGSDVVYFNLRKNPRELNEMVNTAIHEWLHVVGFDHGGNRKKGKQDSVNYKVGKIAEKYTGGCK